MYLRDLSVSASDNAEFPAGYDGPAFNRHAYHVREIFLSFLPGKYELDGMAKTNLYLGPRGDDNQYQQLINVNICYHEPFDFGRFFAGDEREREEMVLAAIETSLGEIAARFDSDPEPIREAAAATRACGFRRKFYLKKLCRSTKSRKLRVNVFREIVFGGERWGIDFTNRDGDILETRWITESTFITSAGYAYRKSLWKGERFVILDFQGRQKYKINVGPIERKLFPSKQK